MFKAILASLALIFSLQLSAQNTREQFDQYGRIIRNEKNEKFNFTEKETIKLSSSKGKIVTNGYQLLNSSIQSGPILNLLSSGELTSDALWNYTIMGEGIGENSLHSLDIDKDGTTEIICGATYRGGYWYILEYDEKEAEFKIVWTGDYSNERVNAIEVFDVNNDSIFEICVAYNGGQLNFYDGQSLQKTGTYNTEQENRQVRYGDADNDGIAEIVVLTDEDIVLINGNTFDLEDRIPQDESAYDFEIGNIDGDANLEIILSSGKAFQYTGGVASDQWEFDTGYGGSVEIADIDQDGIDEVVFAAGWYTLKVFDADTRTTKYTMDADLDIADLLLQDINNDGIAEIIYGDGQWGSIYCHDANTKALLWEISNPEHGITKVSVADVDGNDTLDVLWGAGYSSSGKDVLFVANMVTGKITWESKHIDGPFYAIETGDVDDDEDAELVVVSYESNSGYDSGILTIFNAATKEVEWQSDGEFFKYTWSGIYNVEINDVDSDGQTEIIVAAGKLYTGMIWILNGKTRLIESSYTYQNEDMGDFYALAIDDLYHDNTKEIIVASQNEIAIIDPVDFHVVWKNSVDVNYLPSKILTENIDNDASREILLCKNYIYLIEASSKQIKQSSESGYTQIDLFDVNHDGFKEIIGVDISGNIEVLDSNLVLLSRRHILSGTIGAIRVCDLNNDQNPEYILTLEGRLILADDSANIKISKTLSHQIAGYDGIDLYDFDNDGRREFIFGTTHQVVILPSAIYSCLWHSFKTITDGPDCDANNGTIKIVPKGGIAPYIFEFNQVISDSIINDLAPGSYYISVTDNIGCIKEDSVIFEIPELITDITTENVTCNENANGTAIATVIKGTLPIAYQWSTGAGKNPQLEEFSRGEYWLKATDAGHCISNEEFKIEKDSIMLSAMKSDIDCYGNKNGWIQIWLSGEHNPIEINWSNGSANSYIYGLSPGNYTVNVSDVFGCYRTDTFTIRSRRK